MDMLKRIRAGWKSAITTCSILTGAALLAQPAQATLVPFDPLSGFDNSSLNLAVDYDILAPTDWLGAGTGSSNAVEIIENQCLRVLPTDPCSGTLPLNAGPYSSEVTWDFINRTTRTGSALLFISGFAPFAPDGSQSYDFTQVGIHLEAADAAAGSSFVAQDFDVTRYSVSNHDFFYLTYRIDDFSRRLRFTYSVDALQLSGGTPQLYTNAAFDFEEVPEPSTAVLLGTGLIGLGIYRRRR